MENFIKIDVLWGGKIMWATRNWYFLMKKHVIIMIKYLNGSSDKKNPHSAIETAPSPPISHG